jgi:AraC-like DNA-binding protein
MLHITPNYLNEVCTRDLGFSAKSLIEEQVMLEIKRLLFHTDLSIKEISFQLNFEDPSYFIRRFKEKNGMTPAAFRDASRG